MINVGQADTCRPFSHGRKQSESYSTILRTSSACMFSELPPFWLSQSRTVRIKEVRVNRNMYRDESMSATTTLVYFTSHLVRADNLACTNTAKRFYAYAYPTSTCLKTKYSLLSSSKEKETFWLRDSIQEKAIRQELLAADDDLMTLLRIIIFASLSNHAISSNISWCLHHSANG